MATRQQFCNVMIAAAMLIFSVAIAQGEVITITTEQGRGADAYGRDGAYRYTNNGTSGGIVAKNDAVDYNRKAWVRFDVGSMTQPAIGAEFQLVLASKLANQHLTYNVYGLHDGYTGGSGTLGEDWEESQLTWNNAPANDIGSYEGVTIDAQPLLTQFTVFSSSQLGDVFSISSQSMLDFVNADTNGLITFIITQQTHAAGDVFGFASKENATYDPPSLRLNVVPEPSTLVLLGMGALGLLGWAGRRRK